jgi:hypothetical protein
MNGKIHRQCWWVQGICGQNRPSTKALSAKNEMPTQQLEQDKQHGNEETYASQRGNEGQNQSGKPEYITRKPRVTY